MNEKKRKICLVTGSRAEYGLMYWLIKYLSEGQSLELQLIVTGMHLSPEFGNTFKTIENDGFKITEKIDILLSSDSNKSIAKSIGLATISFADAFDRLKPDIVIILGDRYEIFAVAQTATILNIPIAHIHGGEITQGAVDESFRHSISKMSHLHFVAAEEYKKRIIQLGENPNNVFNFGSPGLDNLNKINLLSKEDLQGELGLKFGKFNFLITYHPETLSSTDYLEQSITQLISALNEFPDAHLFFTGANSDSNGRYINNKFISFVSNEKNRSVFHISLGQQKFISLLRHIDLIIGNSSSALIEAAALKVPAINIGNRQNGRIKSSSVIDCNNIQSDIVISIKKALSDTFKETLKIGNFPYGTGENNSFKIYKKIKEYNLDHILIKKFHDI